MLSTLPHFLSPTRINDKDFTLVDHFLAEEISVMLEDSAFRTNNRVKLRLYQDSCINIINTTVVFAEKVSSNSVLFSVGFTNNNDRLRFISNSDTKMFNRFKVKEFLYGNYILKIDAKRLFSHKAVCLIKHLPYLKMYEGK